LSKTPIFVKNTILFFAQKILLAGTDRVNPGLILVKDLGKFEKFECTAKSKITMAIT